MTGAERLAATPAPQGLVRLLHQQSATIDRMCQRFLTSGDAEALHDLRVSLRRLRALFTGFAPYLDMESTLPKQLRLLQQETNRARDFEVMLALVERWQLPLPELQQQWQEELAKEYQRLRHQLPAHWQALTRELQSPEHLLAKGASDLSLGVVTAEIEDKAEGKLFTTIAAQRKQWSKRRAHKLRIQGKRLRYLIEPFSGESREAEEALRQLKQLQDLLGDYHDVFILRQRIKKAIKENGLSQGDRPKRARRLLKKRARKLRKRFLHRYDGKAKSALRQGLRGTAAALAQS